MDICIYVYLHGDGFAGTYRVKKGWTGLSRNAWGYKSLPEREREREKICIYIYI